jgi:transcriptional regulator with XRE-family HTH domain
VSKLFSERLLDARKSVGMKASDIAGKVGISKAYLSQLETGKREKPSIDLIKRLAVTLGVSVNHLADCVADSQRADHATGPIAAPPSPAVLRVEAGESSRPPYGRPPLAELVNSQIPARGDLAGEVAALRAKLAETDRRLETMSVQLATLLAVLGDTIKSGIETRVHGNPKASVQGGEKQPPKNWEYPPGRET